MDPASRGINLMPTLGACLITSVITTALWGANAMQMLIYYSKPRRDPLLLRMLPAFLTICDTTRIIMIFRGLFRALVERWGDVSVIQLQVPEFLYQNILFGIITVCSQAFFLFRIYNLTGRSIWLVIGSVIFLTFELVAPPVFIGMTQHISTLDGISGSMDPRKILYAFLAISVAVDLFITVTVSTYAWMHRTGSFADRLLVRLVIFTISTGLWTLGLAIGILIAMFAAPLSLAGFALEFLISGAYVTSVLASLNGRNWVAQGSSSSQRGLPSFVMNDRVWSSSGVVREGDMREPGVFQFAASTDSRMPYFGGVGGKPTHAF